MNWSHSDIEDSSTFEVARDPVAARKGFDTRSKRLTPWLEHYRPIKQPRVRLFCFHHAGGSALAFRDWHRYLPPTVEVCPVQLPGRGTRQGEDLLKNLLEMSASAAAGVEWLLDVPFAMFGFSMGGLVAFEATRLLEARGLVPCGLFVAACGAPHLRARVAERWRSPREDLIKELRRMKGTPEEVLQNAELMDILLEIVRSDFEAIANYRAEKGAKVRCPISAIAATDDVDAPPDQVSAWECHTSGRFFFNSVHGDHFFALREPGELIRHVRHGLREFAGVDRLATGGASNDVVL